MSQVEKPACDPLTVAPPHDVWELVLARVVENTRISRAAARAIERQAAELTAELYRRKAN